MRRIFVATLVLIPVLANAQASSSTGPKQSPNSAMLLAKSTPPAPFASAKGAAPAPKSSADITATLPANVIIHQAGSDSDFAYDTVDHGGTIAYSLGGADSFAKSAAPQLVHVVETELAPAEIAAGSDVCVRLTVDAYGVPQNLKVTKATDPVVAQKTLAAVSQYRFKPARVNYLAVAQDVNLDIKIK